MIDFRTKLKAKTIDRKINPKELYESLDRAVDKGPLRQTQDYILNDWFTNYKEARDIIIKLHTGQGKTLIGLLILLSRINQEKGPSLYLCPNNLLVKQTCMQAEQFGVPFCEVTTDIPIEFLDGKKILITSVQKFFNGLSKFGVGRQAVPISTILVDDAHTCIEAIKQAGTITFKHTDQAYSELLSLFATDLEYQGAGTFTDIKNQVYDALQYVPYWAWQDRQQEVMSILSKYNETQNVMFAWPLIKDNLLNCYCVISGKSIEIAPTIIPLYLFGSFTNASQRIFMSATFFDDSFLVKGFGISEQTIRTPLVYPSEKWAGEKMVLIPSLIDDSLSREKIVEYFCSLKKQKFGIVILTNSFPKTKDWAAYGCPVANTEDIKDKLLQLKNNELDKPLVIANRYDGIDLPDHMCRLLILDSKPNLGSLFDKYMQNCRPNSIIIESKIAQTIEQGMGRAVRGEKDFCAIILIGTELIKAIHSSKSRRFLSIQTRTQIEIGLEVSEFARQTISDASESIKTMVGILNQLLKRDEGWKDFYIQRMNEMQLSSVDSSKSLNILLLEKQSDKAFIANQPRKAIEYYQNIIDQCGIPDEEKGWYLQEMARMLYSTSKLDSKKMQIVAHQKNRFLLKPIEGMLITKLVELSQRRAEKIKDWIKTFRDYSELQLSIQDILSALVFGSNYRQFERALDELGQSLGFQTQRPDKEWKAGPDNLWLIEDNKYLLFECKNQVELTRKEINKEETGQMNNSIAWFEKIYGQCNATFVQIIPTKDVSSAAGYNRDVLIMRQKGLNRLNSNARAFYKEFANQNLNDLSVEHINTLLITHHLAAKDFTETVYTEHPILY